MTMATESLAAAAAAMKQSGYPLDAIAQHFSVSTRTIHRWVAGQVRPSADLAAGRYRRRKEREQAEARTAAERAARFAERVRLREAESGRPVHLDIPASKDCTAWRAVRGKHGVVRWEKP